MPGGADYVLLVDRKRKMYLRCYDDRVDILNSSDGEWPWRRFFPRRPRREAFSLGCLRFVQQRLHVGPELSACLPLVVRQLSQFRSVAQAG